MRDLLCKGSNSAYIQSPIINTHQRAFGWLLAVIAANNQSSVDCNKDRLLWTSWPHGAASLRCSNGLLCYLQMNIQHTAAIFMLGVGKCHGDLRTGI